MVVYCTDPRENVIPRNETPLEKKITLRTHRNGARARFFRERRKSNGHSRSFTADDTSDRSIEKTINHNENSVELTTLLSPARVLTLAAVYSVYNIYNSTTFLH